MYVQDADFTDGDFVSDKVEVDLNVLRALVLDQIGGHVHCTHIVAINKSGPSQRGVQLQEQLSKPGSLCNTVSNCPIFRFSTGT